MATTSVKHFTSQMTGAPSLSGTTGTLIALLDACLINGFNLVTLDSLVVSGGVATATKSGGHGYSLHQVVTIAGATPSGLNGEQRVSEILSSTQFTFATTEGDTTASGTITAKASPVGSWEKAYSGTNTASYRSTDAASTGHYLYIADDGSHASGARVAKVRGYANMTDATDSGTWPFPTVASAASGWSALKSYTADSAAMPWSLVADELMFYFVASPRVFYENAGAALFFGDIKSYRGGDGYQCVLVALDTNWSVYSSTPSIGCYFLAYLNNIAQRRGMLASRSYTGVGDPIQLSCFGGDGDQVYSGYGSVGVNIYTYPHPIDGGLWLTKTIAKEDSHDNVRGEWPGVFTLCHSHVFSPFSVVDGVGENSDRVGMAVQLAQGTSWSNTAYIEYLMDITGPWRN